MSELLPSPDTTDHDSQNDDLDLLNKAEAVINHIKDSAQQISWLRFASEEEAEVVHGQLQVDVESCLDTLPYIDKVDMQISGNGVTETITQATPEEYYDIHGNKVGVGILIPGPTSPFVDVGSFEERYFRYDSYATRTARGDEGDWRVETLLYGMHTRDITDTKTEEGERTGRFTVETVVRIDCAQSNSSIELVDLAHERQRKRALRALDAVVGDDREVVLGAMRTLSDAVNGEDPTRMMPVGDMRSLHILGELGAKYALEGEKKSDALTEAVAAVIGRGREVGLNGFGYCVAPNQPPTEEFVDGLYGSVESIFPDVPFDVAVGQSVGPTIVVISEGRTYFMPLARLEGLSL